MELTFATLMARAGDEPDAHVRPRGARGADLRRRADLPLPAAARGALPRRHASSPRTTSPSRSTLLKEKGHPIITQLMRDFAGAEADDDATVVVRFAPKRGARRAAVRRRPADLLARLLQRRSLSTRRRSRCRSAPAPTRSAASRPGRYIEYERVKDWWGADLPVSRGQNNFDTVRYEFYRDRDVGFEGFHRQELSVPRGVHLAHLGDALRLSRRSRTAA